MRVWKHVISIVLSLMLVINLSVAGFTMDVQAEEVKQESVNQPVNEESGDEAEKEAGTSTEPEESKSETEQKKQEETETKEKAEDEAGESETDVEKSADSVKRKENSNRIVAPAPKAEKSIEVSDTTETIDAQSEERTPEGYVIIDSVEDLKNIKNDLAGKYSLEKDLDLSAEVWSPLGGKEKPFTGVFEGNGKSITGLTLKTDTSNTESYVGGLFAYVKNAEINNINFKKFIADITVRRAEKYAVVGAVVAFAEETVISGCNVDGTITVNADTSYVGGICGVGYASTIKNANTSGTYTVKGKNFRVGGITGTVCGNINTKAVVVDCNNKAAITADSNADGAVSMGGIVGGYDSPSDIHSSSQSDEEILFMIENCNNSGSINCESSDSHLSVAGILGDTTQGEVRGIIKKCDNSGNIFSSSNNFSTAAGIVSERAGGTPYTNVMLEQCSNSGAIYGVYCAAGISVSLKGEGAYIKNSYNQGDVTSGVQSAGIVCFNSVGEVDSCYNIGTIDEDPDRYYSTRLSAGIAVENEDVISNSYNAGYIKGTECGGITVKNASYAIVKDCYNIGGLYSEEDEGAIATDNDNVVEDTYYYENVTDGIANSSSGTTNDSVKLNDEQMKEQQSYEGFDFAAKAKRTFRAAKRQSTPAWTMSEKTGMPKLLNVPEVYIQKIVVLSKPSNTVVHVNSNINTSGLKVRIYYSNGKYEDITKGYVLKPYSKSEGTRNITLCYGGKTATFNMTFKHSYTSSTTKSTCSRQGSIKYTCTGCGHSYSKALPLLSHSYTTATTKATTSKRNGSIVKKCRACGKVASKSTIYYPKTVKLSTTSYTYNGKTKKPSVKVIGSNGKTISKTNYKVSYSSGRKNVGRYKVKVTFRGNYSGSITKTFDIKPKGTSVSKVSAGRKKAVVRWKKQTKQTTGYQIQYSTDKKFRKGNKTVTIKKNKTTSKTIKKLRSKKKYYVRVRTYKKAKYGRKYISEYSSWSKVKSVRVR